MRIQDVGLWIGIGFVIVAISLFSVMSLFAPFRIDLSSTGIPYIEYSPYIFGGMGLLFAIVSLISLAKSKE